jgi:predicted RNase H-like nuclease (RuvC/YqgF family)
VAQIELDTDIRNREAAVARLTQDLEASVKESKSLQVICRDLQREVEQQKSALNKTTDLSRHIEQFEGEVKAIAGLLTEKSRRLEGLSETCRDVGTMLKSLGKA